ELAGFLGVVAHEELAHTKTVSGHASDADQKRARACAAREAGGFRVQKRPFFGSSLWADSIGDGFEEIVRKIEQCANIRTAVPFVRLPELFRFEVPAILGFDFAAGQPLFDVPHRRAWERRLGRS